MGGNDQAAIDSHCAPCANGQTWWPCNLENACQCADAAPETDAPSTDAPTTEGTTTEAPVTTTVAPVTTAPVTTTKYETQDCEIKECDANCNSCIAIPGNSQ